MLRVNFRCCITQNGRTDTQIMWQQNSLTIRKLIYSKYYRTSREISRGRRDLTFAMGDTAQYDVTAQDGFTRTRERVREGTGRRQLTPPVCTDITILFKQHHNNIFEGTDLLSSTSSALLGNIILLLSH